MDIQKLEPILKRIDSCHLAHLWSFYRPAFESDQRCIDFFSMVFHFEPEDPAITYDEETDDIVCMKRERVPIQEEAFSPAEW